MVLDALGIVLSFALILLGAVSREWWFSYFWMLIFLALYPEPGTFWMLLIELAAAWAWTKSHHLFSPQAFIVVALLLTGAIVALTLSQPVIGIVFSIALVFLLLLSPTIFVAKKTSRKAREIGSEVKKGLQTAKGQHPDFYGELEKMSTTAGKKLGDAIAVTPDERVVSDNTGLRVTQGAQNLLDGLRKLFK